MKKISLTLISSLMLVFLATLANAYRFEGIESQLTTDSKDQFDPSISGAVTVYTDRRGADADIYMFDVSTGVETQITSGGGDQYFNDISGDNIVYTDFGLGNAEIFLYNISTGDTLQVTDNPANQRNPAISGDRVVYEDDRNGDYEIYMTDLSTGERVETRITNDPAIQRNPAISGTIVVWEDYRNGQPDVYMLDLVSGIETRVTSDLDQDRNPDVDGDVIAFDSNRSSVGDVFIYRISTGTLTAVTADTDYERNPAVSGDYVAYESYAGGDADIWLYSIFLGVSEQATVDQNEQYLHALSGNRLVYTDNRNNNPDGYNLDIYMFEFVFDDPDIDVSLQSYDFGDVNVGGSSTTIITISNVGTGPLIINGIAFQAGSSSDFAITASPVLPATVTGPDGTIDVEITYSPSGVGYSSATLNITTNDSDEGVVEISLGGAGVLTEPPPEEEIAEVLDYFDDSVGNGNLVGEGPGNSAGKRLNALRNMIESAGDLIKDGLFDEACEQLADVLKKTDGLPKPPDFVSGPAATKLASMIEDLRVTLGCE